MGQFLRKSGFIAGLICISLLSPRQTKALERLPENSYYNPTDIITHCQDVHKNDRKAYQECLRKGLLEKDYKKLLRSQKDSNPYSALERFPTDEIAIESGEDILDTP